ncbi:MAG: 3-keto-5-aminohexanoate cleavage protein [Alphaproteobacteria bacterium]
MPDPFIEPLVVAVAPNGARKTKSDHPDLPITPREVALTAAACRDAGASLIHLHVRDANEGHTLDADAYRLATAAIREEVGDSIVIQVTSEAVGIYTPDQQMAMVQDIQPESVSLAIREICPDQSHEKQAAAFLDWLRRERIHPHYILYSADDVALFADLRFRGVVPGDRPFVLYVLGRYTKGQVSDPSDLLPFLEAAKDQSVHWSVCAFGKREAACGIATAALGGHVRVGFENNLFLADGQIAPDNAALVKQVTASASMAGRPVADADAARALLGIGR